MGFSVLVLAAGLGTRMHSDKPKVAHEVLGKPLLRWVIDTAWAAGASSVVTVVGHGRETTAPLAHDTTVVYQEEQLGTGHAVLIAREAVKAGGEHTLVVLSGDVPLLEADTLKQAVETHTSRGAAVSILTMQLNDPSGYGRIVRNAEGAFERIVEHKDATEAERALREVNGGVYCFAVDALYNGLERINSSNAQGEYYLTDVPALALAAGGCVVASPVCDPWELAGINDRVQLAEVTAEAQRRINHRHMRAGVTILDPSTVWIGPDVTLQRDVEILPLTTLTGKTSVGWGTVIGPMSRVNNSTIGQSCVIDDSVLVNVMLENRVSVGPRAYLRPGTVMRSGSRAGTHVEIKKSEIGENSKVPHLSYIGDATLGSEVNVGAGSITCNYDGENKHPTVIGSGSFVGSDTMFVAPITMGENAYTGAGSVITKDIPSGALAVSRPEQITKEGFARKDPS